MNQYIMLTAAPAKALGKPNGLRGFPRGTAVGLPRPIGDLGEKKY